MRILGLDVGSHRVGVAISDPLGLLAQPLEVIDRQRGDAHSRIAELVEEHGVDRIVVGQPVRLDGSLGLAATAVHEFVTKLTKQVQCPITMWDERLTTAQAEREMIAGNVRRERRRQTIDKVAAALMLQSYLDAHGRPPEDLPT